MSWEDVAPRQSAHRGGSATMVVSCSSNGAGARFSHWLGVTIRAREIDLAWLKVGALVKVQRNGVQMRLCNDGAHVLGNVGGWKAVKDTSLCVLRLPALATQSRMKFGSTRCDYEIAEGMLVFTLPAWCFSEIAAQGAIPDIARPPAAGAAPFKIGAPSHADVNRRRGVPGAD